MSPVRVPDVVRGDVPGLLCRGMPVRWRDEETRYVVTWAAPTCDDDPEGNWNVMAAPEGEPCLGVLDAGSNFDVDWSDRAAIYLCLAWLADRGHACTWMLPAAHGGRVEAWDGLSAWEVSAILVARSVGRVARGVGPVAALAGAWHHDPNPGDAYESWGWTAWMRTRVDGRGAVRVYVPTRARPLAWGLAGWYYYRKGYGYQPPTSSGRQTGDAGKLAADRAALADGCALHAPSGLILPDLGAEHE